jgi:pimeloyl-ACP methyl ester carboxylesterase
MSPRPSNRLLLAGAVLAGSVGSTALRSRRIDAASAARRARPEGRALSVAAADGTRLHTRIHGPDGAPTIVFAHCWTGTQELWHNQVAELAGEYRLVVYDQRGHGLSEQAGHLGYTLDALAEDLDSVLDATTKPGEPVMIAGHSMGAMTIFSWAGRHRGEVGSRVRSAVICSTGVNSLTAESTVLGAWPAAFSTVQGRITDGVLGAPLTVRTLPVGFARAAVHYMALGPAAREEDVELTLRMLYDCTPRARAGFGNAMARMDLDHAVDALDVPAIVVTGGKDLMTPLGHAERIAGGLEEAELLVDPEAGHMTPLESPELVNGALRELAQRTLVEASTASA